MSDNATVAKLKNDLLKENILQYGFADKGGRFDPYTLGDIEVFYYGGNLCSITIDGDDIEDLLDDFPPCSGPDDDLCYKLDEAATEFLLKEIIRNGGVCEDPPT